MNETLPKSRRSAAYLIFATYVPFQFILVTGSLAGPTFKSVFELSNTELGIALGASSAGLAIMSLPAGHLSHRWGAYSVLNIGLVGWLAGLGMLVFTVNYAMLLMGLLTVGLASAMVFNANVTLLAELFHDNVRKVMSSLASSWLAVSMVVFFGLGFWFDFALAPEWVRWSFRGPYLIGAVLVVACLLLNRVIIPKALAEATESHSTAPADANDDVPRRSGFSRGISFILLMGVCHGLMMMALIKWLNPLAHDKFGLGNREGSWLLVGFCLGAAVGRLVLAVAKLHWDERRILIVSQVVGGAVWLWALLSRGYPSMLVILTLGSFITCTSLPCLYTIVVTRYRATKSKLFGYLEASFATGGFIGAAAVGGIVDLGAPVWFALCISPLAAWTLALLAFLWNRGEK